MERYRIDATATVVRRNVGTQPYRRYAIVTPVTTETRRVPAGAAVLRGEITTAIRQAVMQELAEVGYGRLSIEAVARRAGVGKTAVYRRWSSKLEMVLELVSGGGRARACRCRTPAPCAATWRCSCGSSPGRCSTRWPRRSSRTCSPRRPATRRSPRPSSEALRANQRDVGALLDRPGGRPRRAARRHGSGRGRGPDRRPGLLAAGDRPHPAAQGLPARMAAAIAAALGAATGRPVAESAASAGSGRHGVGPAAPPSRSA